MKTPFLISLLTLLSCTTVTTQVETTENDHVIMSSSEESTFSDPEQKLKMEFSPAEGGQILSIFWEGKLIADSISESYPNKDLDFKKLNARVLDDGSGLIIVDSNVRGQYQLRRSYSLKYLEEKDQHIIEVIYNVKNYSSEVALDQQWVQSLSLPEGYTVKLKNNSINTSNKNTLFRIEAINVKDLQIENENNKLKLNNMKSFKLGTKERLSWKVLYILKN